MTYFELNYEKLRFPLVRSGVAGFRPAQIAAAHALSSNFVALKEPFFLDATSFLLVDHSRPMHSKQGEPQWAGPVEDDSTRNWSSGQRAPNQKPAALSARRIWPGFIHPEATDVAELTCCEPHPRLSGWRCTTLAMLSSQAASARRTNQR